MQQVPTAIALDSADPLERMTRLDNKSIAGNAWAEASAAVLPWWVAPCKRLMPVLPQEGILGSTLARCLHCCWQEA